jgi:hypothetical protein
VFKTISKAVEYSARCVDARKLVADAATEELG